MFVSGHQTLKEGVTINAETFVRHRSRTRSFEFQMVSYFESPRQAVKFKRPKHLFSEHTRSAKIVEECQQIQGALRSQSIMTFCSLFFSTLPSCWNLQPNVT